jgi:excinuclease ABC subunit C
VKAACEFLTGQTAEMEEQLNEAMRKAAAAQDFENAARYRDALADLRKTTQRTTRFERTPWNLRVAVMPDRDNAELGQALGLPGPPGRIEGFDISNISGTLKVASVVSFRNGRPDRANYRRMRIKTVEGQDDFACMAEAVRRRYSRLLRETGLQTPGAAAEPNAGEAESAAEETKAIPQELRTLINSRAESRELRRNAAKDANDKTKPSPGLPDLIVVDGGKGQLSAACAELAKLQLSGIPIIGLAKEFEDIYRPGEDEPLRLGEEHCALKLLQRIRDESHRVANSYNAQLRLKRISESILDEFPGIGQRRKAALLQKFGSVQRLRTATTEEIAQVPGFGGKAAAELKAFLEARTIL